MPSFQHWFLKSCHPSSHWKKTFATFGPNSNVKFALAKLQFLHSSFTDCSNLQLSQWKWLGISVSLADGPKHWPQCGQVSLTPWTFLVPNKMNMPKPTKLSQAWQFVNWKWLQVQDLLTKSYLALAITFYEEASRVM